MKRNAQRGVWQRGISAFKTPLEEIWKSYLDGHGARDDALAEFIKGTARTGGKAPKL